MNIISCCKLLILITQTIHSSEHIKHKNESSSIVACKGEDVDLLWKVDEEESKISKLEWYFNNKTICTSSPENPFTVKPPYQGRIEMIGKTGIRLKNVSIDDEGTFILLPVIKWSTSLNMQKIALHILEPPTNKCTCNIGYPPDFTFEETESYCGRPQVSLVWKRKETFEVLGEGNHILNSTLQDKEVLCCQVGEAMKCVDDSRQFCTTVSIPHRDIPETDTGSTNIHHIQLYVLVTLTVCVLTALLVLVFLIINCKMRKNNKNLEEIVTMLKLHAVKPLKQDDPKLEKASTLYEHQHSPSLETMQEIQELRQAALCQICFVKEISVVYMPCSHSVTCANCSIPLKQCPVCSVLIKMKMNICSD